MLKILMTFWIGFSHAEALKIELPGKGTSFDYKCSNGTTVTQKIGETKTVKITPPTFSAEMAEALKKLNVTVPPPYDWQIQFRRKYINEKYDQVYQIAPQLYHAYGDIHMTSGKSESAAFPLTGSLMTATQLEVGKSYDLVLVERGFKRGTSAEGDTDALFKMKMDVVGNSTFDLNGTKYKTIKTVESRERLLGGDLYTAKVEREYAPELKMLVAYKVERKGTPTMDCRLISVK